MSLLNRNRVHGYIIASSVGLALGLMLDAVDLDVLLAKKDKALKIVGAFLLVTSAVSAAFYEPPFSHQEDRPTRDLSGAQDQPSSD